MSSIPVKPTKSTVRQLFQDEIYLEAILWQQARQLTGRPGWPSTTTAVYQCLLDQIEADISTGPCPQ